MFFVIPEKPSNTFVMLYKKLPDNFKQFLPTQDSDEPVRGVADDVVEDGEGLAGLLGARGAHGGGVQGGNLVVDRLIRTHGP